MVFPKMVLDERRSRKMIEEALQNFILLMMENMRMHGMTT